MIYKYSYQLFIPIPSCQLFGVNFEFISDFDRRTLLDKLKQYSVAGIVPEFIDLKFLYVELNSAVYYNTNAVSDPDTLKTTIVSNLNTYARSEDLNKFGGRFKYSKIQKIIDDSSPAIVSNITKVKIRRNIEAIFENPSQYELCYGNAFHAGRNGYNIKSTGFSVSGIDGTVYLSDKVVEGSDIGNIFLFRLNTDSEVEIVSTKFGTVNYKTGEILIDTVNITSTSLPENIIEVQAIPLSNDVLARKELYLQLDVAKSNFTMRQDSISSGANTSGTRYSVQSSYQNGKKTR